MEISNNSSVYWSKKINSDSRTVDLLGLYGKHLRVLTSELTPGITSVTNRIRYYTMLPWYWENLFQDENVDYNDIQKIFILTCLAHHNGDYSDPKLKHVINIQKFKDNWDDKDSFSLRFQINGLGKTYYRRQLDFLRCAWTNELNNQEFTSINREVASAVGSLPLRFFKKKTFTKDELKDMGEQGFCICKSQDNNKEIDLMSKLLFGFFNLEGNDWKIDNSKFNLFVNGILDLKFELNPLNDLLNFELESDSHLAIESGKIQEMNMKRRNTLLMFLKIIGETSPPIRDFNFKRFFWDAVYFKQNRENKRKIDFFTLEKIRKYWEHFQLNVYYVYTMEKFLDLIQQVISKNPGIKKNDITKTLDITIIYEKTNLSLNSNIKTNSKISEVLEHIMKLNGTAKTNLNSIINESIIYDNIDDSESLEEMVAYLQIFFILLFNRYKSIKNDITNYYTINKDLEPFSLFISEIFQEFEEKVLNQKTMDQFLNFICSKIIERHLYVAATRLSTGTRNWLFIEEDNRLFFDRKLPVIFHPQENRWLSIRNILLDLKFIQNETKHVILTGKGLEWLKRINLI